MSLDELRKIKARLGSINPVLFNSLSISMQKLLEGDFPRVIAALEAFLGRNTELHDLPVARQASGGAVSPGS